MNETTKTVVAKVKSSGTVSLTAFEVWRKLIAFGGTEKFVPNLIEKVTVMGEGVGAVRTVFLKGGGEIVEQLSLINQEMQQMHFVILSTPMPVNRYEGVIRVTVINDHQCQVDFESIYEVAEDQKAEMNRIIQGFQRTFISNLHC